MTSFYHSGKFVLFREKLVIKNRSYLSLENSFLGWCFGLRLALDVRPTNFVDDLGIAFVDGWVVGNEKS